MIFSCLNRLHSFAIENQCEYYKIVCKNKIFCHVVMPSEGTKILQFSQYLQSYKASFVIYADLECLIGKIDGCKSNTEN